MTRTAKLRTGTDARGSTQKGLGVSLGFVLVLLFNQALIESLKLPFLSPGIFWTLGMFFLVILAAAASGPLASLKTIYHINKKDPAIAVRENE
ncbi:hypothetical protein [Treponema phagedenis]|uniref:hypothetical protein n=1 Tax=Treponema phagedenis TaxID=162 RepID=UPI00201806D9|nr:hypothetical protein [Treponema phagedenis]